ncbi:MAG: site-specific DNA-methyltransferase [Lachnospiraceae bacterium]|nr:site-specific DNA-methyltransferase [Lachnospiraceae bacterium]
MYNTIINGNSIEEMNKMKAESVDLIFADPPYWMRVEGVLQRVEGTDFDGCDDEWDQFESLEDYEKFTREWLEACYRVLKPNGSIWVIGGMQCIYTMGAIMQEIGYWLINDVVWHKKNPTPNFKGTRLNNSHETLIWATKSKKSKFTFHYKTAKELNTDTVSEEEFAKGIRKQLGSVWRISVCSGNERLKDEAGNKVHSTQKPEELLYRIIAISSKMGDVVLDPFGGTMTTGAIAKRLGRKYIMIERDETYCKFGSARIEAEVFEDTPIARADFDKKPLKVSVPEMIEKNFFIEGEWFYLKSGEQMGILQRDGQLLYKGELLDMHTCAARARGVKASRLNGFDVWYVMRDEQLVSIADIREAYRCTLLSE